VSYITSNSGRKGEAKPLSLVLVLSLSIILLLFLSPVIFQGLFVLAGHASQILYGVFFIADGEPPFYEHVQQSLSKFTRGGSVELSAQWTDNVELDYAWLATNETGEWKNHSGIYGSPYNLVGNSDWSNFTWENSSIIGVVGWRIYAVDINGNANRTEIGSFLVEELPPPPPPGPGAPSPPPLGPVPVKNFTVEPDLIKVSIKQGKSVRKTLSIKNIGDLDLNITIDPGNIGRFVVIDEQNFTLLTGQNKTINIDIFAREDEVADAYTGRILVTGDGITEIVNVIIEVKARGALFDIDTSIFEKIVNPGDEIEADIMLYNYGDLMPVDVTLYYALRDFAGNDILYEYVTLAVEEEKLVKRVVTIPPDLELGFYIFYSRLEYENQTAASASLINVVEPEKPKPPELPWTEATFIAVAIIVSVLVAVLYKQHITRRILIEKLKRLPERPMEMLEAIRRERRLAELEAEREREARLVAESMAQEERKARLMAEQREKREQRAKKRASERLKKNKKS